MKNKIQNPGIVLLLSIVTCGIYGYYTIYRLTDEIKQYRNDPSINPALELILCIVTCSLYSIYWCYKYSKLIFEMQNTAGVENPSDISVIALILPILGLFVVSLLLMQGEINKVWEKTSA